MFALFLAISLLLVNAESPAAARPHIVLICLDDIGRTDTGIYGKSNIPMPNLMALSKQGAVLENFYTQTVCSPTRSSLMTGKFPFRFGMQHYTTQLPGMTAGIPLHTPTIAELVKQVGYDTHAIGKWHCGYASAALTPTQRGFNTYLGYLQAQGDYYKHNFAVFPTNNPVLERLIDGLDFWDNEDPMYTAVGNYSLDLYDRQITKVLNHYAVQYDSAAKRAEHPFFLYLAHQTVHIPLQPRQDERARCKHIAHTVRRTYCSMMVEMDDSIGSMVKQMKHLNMWENTLVVLLTDNGGMVNFDPNSKGYPNLPASQGSNFPLRGSKMTLFDGGVRSLGFVSGGVFPKQHAGQRFGGLAHVVDLSATVLAAAGVANSEKLKLDGNDLMPLFTGKPNAVQRTEVPINIVDQGQKYSAIRFNTKYKLIIKDHVQPRAQAWFDRNGDLQESAPDVTKSILLFDLEQDVEERHDLSQEYPHLVQRGMDLIQSYVQSGSYMEPQNSLRVYLKAFPVNHNGVWRPFMSKMLWSKNFERQEKKQHVVTEEEDEEEVTFPADAFTVRAGDNMEVAAAWQLQQQPQVAVS